MFDSGVLEVGIGLIFTFLTVSLICGSVTETVATMLSWRSATLMDGIKKLVNDPKGTGLALQLYNASLVHARGDGKAMSTGDVKQPPSYIDPQHFAKAFIDAVAVGQTSIEGIKGAVANIENPQLKQFLTTEIRHAGASVDTLRDHVAAWFDASMDRVGGDYKRRTQVWCFFIGLAIAIFLNIDTLHIATALWHSPALTKGIGNAPITSTAIAIEAVKSLGLPIGWTQDRLDVWNSCNTGAIAAMVVGWGLTAGSTLFGTSFWYDTLSNVLKLRGNGPAPAPAPVPAPAPPVGGGG